MPLSLLLQLSFPRGVFSDTTRLESTSIVLTYGLDLFCSLVRPAAVCSTGSFRTTLHHGLDVPVVQAFDAVGPSFNHALVVAVLIAVISLVIFTRKIAIEKDLASQWK